MISSIAYSEELKLVCKFDNYNGSNRSYNNFIIKSWIPVQQIHKINLNDKAFWNDLEIFGKIKSNNKNKINIEYEYKNSRREWAKYNFVFFKITKKASINLLFPGYQSIGEIWGNCSEKK